MISNWIDDIKEMIFNMFMGGTELFLDFIIELFGKSVSTVRMNVSETPSEFSSTIVDNLRIISETAILPVAGLILTYLFCYEIYQLVVEKNRGNDFETGQLMFLIFKTSIMILLLSNCFDITLAVFDLGKWITDQVPNSALKIPQSIKESLINSVDDGDIGKAMSMWLISGIALIIVFIMSGIVYLVAWGRIITILLYISVAPIPFATFLNKEWIGSIGQTYVKNLLALMLQGYFMLICLVIYAGLLDKASGLIASEGNPLYALMLMLVSMGILVVTLTRTHSIAKSVVGVV